MRDKDTKILEEAYTKFICEENNTFTPKEMSRLENFGEELKQKEGHDRKQQVDVEVTIDDSSASFMIYGAYAVGSQRGTHWDKFSRSVTIDKSDDYLYTIIIDNKSYEAGNFDEAMQYLEDNI